MESDPLDLVTTASELKSANDGMANFFYKEIAPRPLATGDAFFSSEVRFTYHNNATVRSMENMSAIRARIKITDAAGNKVNYEDMLAPNLNPVACLFQKAEWLAAGQTIVSVNENLAEISSLENRIMMTRAQLNGAEKSLSLMQPRFEDRQKMVISDGLSDLSLLNARGRSAAVASIDEASDTLAVVTATGLVTYVDAAGADLDLRRYYKVGDYVSTSDTNLATTVRKTSRITAVTLLTMTLGPGVFVADIVAAVANNAIIDIRKFDQERDTSSLEIMWRVPLGIMNTDVATPSGKYELVLQPFPASVAKQRFFESLGIATNADLNIEIVSIFYYLARFNAPAVSNSTVLLDLVETRCQKQTLQAPTSLQQEDFTVSPATNALTLAFQDSRTDNDTRFASTKFKLERDNDLQLTTFFINYADQQRPQRRPDLQYKVTDGNSAAGVADSIDFLVQQYNNTIQQTKQYFSSGSAETVEEWKERGPYYFQMYPRSGDDVATQVQAFSQFNSAVVPAVANARILLFSHARKVATLSIRNSVIEKVSIDFI